jgi:LPS sulfotransferase NodH
MLWQRPRRADLWLGQFGEEFDLPPWEGEPTTVLLLASTPRSGSHLFGHALQSTGRLGAPLEYFQRRHWFKWCELAAAAGMAPLDYIIRRRTSPNGVFSAKIHYSHITNADLVRGETHWRRLLTFPRVAIVRLKRRNLVRQAISFATAEQTLSWIGAQPVTRDPEYSRAAITKALRHLVLEDASWDLYLARFGYAPAIVYYEDFVADMDAHVRRIGAFAGVEDAETLTVDRDFLPPKQSSTLADDWERRYVEETRTHGDYDPLGPSLMKFEDVKTFALEQAKRLLYRRENRAGPET